MILRLRGVWHGPGASVPTQAKITHADKVTVLELPYEYYLPTEMELSRRTRTKENR